MSQLATLYLTPGSGNSYKPMLVKHQLALTLEVKLLNVLVGETRRPEFLKINPLGVVPYLVLANGTGLGESNALAWYLAEGSALIPSQPLHRAQAVQWMIFEQTSLEPNISPARFFTLVVPDQRSAHEAEFPGWLERGNKALARLNLHLTQRQFITDGDYSVADIAVYGYTHMAEQGGFDLSLYPAVVAWMKRVENSKNYAPISQLLPV